MSQNKDCKLEIRLPKDELEQIKRNAKACGKTVSAYVRETASNMCVLHLDYTYITDHTHEISSYRNAINALIFTIKKTGNYTPADLEYILEQTSKLVKSESEFIKGHSSFVASSKKTIARTVKKAINERLTKQ